MKQKVHVQKNSPKIKSCFFLKKLIKLFNDIDLIIFFKVKSNFPGKGMERERMVNRYKGTDG
jgi:hypothetical protein